MKNFCVKNKAYIIIGVAFIFCFLRALKGFCWTDESFYISTADRFFKGDALLVSEWYRTQLSSVICLPFYAVYVGLTGSNAGVILYFRILYLILSVVTATVAYRVMRKDYPDSVAIIMSVLIMFYAHLNITSLSYYMMSMHFLLLALLIVYDYKNSKSNKNLVIAGVVFALSVMSLPTMAAFYFIVIAVLALVVIASRVIKLPDNIKNYIDSANIMTVIIYTIVGIVIPAAVFAVYLLAKVSIADIITAVPNIMVDNEHDFTFGYCVRRFFFSVSDVYGRFTYIAYALIIGSFVFQKFIKKRIVSDAIVLIDVLLFIAYAYRSYGHTGYIQSALCLFGLPIFFLSRRKNHRLFWLFVSGGMILAMTYSFSSSDFLYVLAIGHFIVALACVAFMYDYVVGWNECDVVNNENLSSISNKIARVAAISLSLIAVYACCVTIALRLTSVYRDAPVSKLVCRIEDGVAKGLYTTPEHLDYYNNVRSVLDEYCMADSAGNSGNDTIMFSKILPWGYMYSDLHCGYPTTWRATAYNADQLEAFYELNPGKEPDIILVLDEEYGSYDASGDVEDDHNPNLDEMNDYWKDYIRTNNMTKTHVKCGVLYKK